MAVLLLQGSFHSIHLAWNRVCTVLSAADFSLFPSVLECSGTGKGGCVSSQVISHIFSSPTIMLQTTHESMVKYSLNLPLKTFKDVKLAKASANSLYRGKKNKVKFSYDKQDPGLEEVVRCLNLGFRKANVLCGRRQDPHRLRYLNIWSPGDDLRGWCNFAGGTTSLEVDIKSLWPYPTSNLSLSISCLWLKMWFLSFLLLSPAAMPPYPDPPSLHANIDSLWDHKLKWSLPSLCCSDYRYGNNCMLLGLVNVTPAFSTPLSKYDNND